MTHYPPDTIRQLRQQATNSLKNAGFESPALDTDILLMHLLKTDRAGLYLQLDKTVDELLSRDFVKLFHRRLSREPIQYITGRAYFYNLELYVDSRTLIPRPETEVVVEKTLEYINVNNLTNLILADIGTGSGAIALALATTSTAISKVYATDISNESLYVAGINIRKHNMAEKIILLQGNLLEPLPEPVDIIISNPPYITVNEMNTLDIDIKDYEPPLALYAGDEGTTFIENLLANAKPKLKTGGAIFLEMGHSQHQQVLHLATKYFPASLSSVFKDLGGHYRVLQVKTMS